MTGGAEKSADEPVIRFLDGRRMMHEFETQVSKEIRILSEVEKIWIIFDVDDSGRLDKEEIQDYIKYMAGPSLKLSDQ